MKYITFTTLMLFLATELFAQVAGVKKVGDRGDYPTLSAAIADINSQGLIDHTILELMNGYDQTESFIIHNYPGCTDYNLTIRPEAGATTAILRSDDAYIIFCDSSNNVAIDGRAGGMGSQNCLKFEHTNNGNSSTLRIDNGSGNTHIHNCTIRFDGSRAINLFQATNSLVEYCDIASYSSGPASNTATIGIKTSHSINSVIRNNRIHHLHVNQDQYFIYGIQGYVPTVATSNDSIYNNFISLNAERTDTTAFVDGINFNGSADHHLYIYFNTIYISGENVAFGSGKNINITTKGVADVFNNICLNTRSNGTGSDFHMAMFYNISDAGMIQSDFNIVNVSGEGAALGFNNGFFFTFDEWQAYSGVDGNSISKPVHLADVRNGDLHLANQSCNDADLLGEPVLNLPYDIDGELRHSSLPYCGADEPAKAAFIESGTIKTPAQAQLMPNYPNPFNAQTMISITVPELADVSLEIFNLRGEIVATIFQGMHEAGTFSYIFDANNLPSGVYFYKLTARGMSQSRKLLLIK
ncbi:T9SS type A sorting domain-containing protein [candidate division KSB1 bacterium]|nr:T9SS type A sorting domain-containing protein [candidate division KSB1 bacterium]